MRLLHTATAPNDTRIILREFHEESVPLYAILSHRWGDDEISFEDVQAGLTREKRKTSGWRKIVDLCKIAREDGFEWAWIDTCCINKASSAELSEAINSMYVWYERSTVCYAYLADVYLYRSAEETLTSFRASTWFSRGWTLQELLAPPLVIFYDATWKDLGTKRSLRAEISRVTGITEYHLLHNFRRSTSVAEKMSWASNRNTTRKEDMAYCLLGIFGVNMPLLYGEGSKAFIRLEHEIIRNHDDDSIFAWSVTKAVLEPSFDPSSLWSLPNTGMLAASPAEFRNCGNFCHHVFGGRDFEPPSITSRGVRLEHPLVSLDRTFGNEFSGILLMLLNCTLRRNYHNRSGGRAHMRFGVLLRKGDGVSRPKYTRIGFTQLSRESGWKLFKLEALAMGIVHVPQPQVGTTSTYGAMLDPNTSNLRWDLSSLAPHGFSVCELPIKLTYQISSKTSGLRLVRSAAKPLDYFCVYTTLNDRTLEENETRIDSFITVSLVIGFPAVWMNDLDSLAQMLRTDFNVGTPATDTAIGLLDSGASISVFVRRSIEHGQAVILISVKYNEDGVSPWARNAKPTARKVSSGQMPVMEVQKWSEI
ncbi:HET-domain-containing protein [Rhizodiscina lignyota]|uniref:HET-domain-containing protein n=1 Tax=Rhizodiscina lignyota TaxID=1504668 RepID=A0A9P4IV17_9PEZI|nr:HET-domain-containing protein [Rhizodiscina lignyota]